MRAFFAINPDEDCIQRIVRIQTLLRKRTKGSFPAPENLHITLAFLGEIDPEQKEMLVQKARSISFEPFALTLKTVDRFKGQRGDHVILKAEESAELNDVHEQVLSTLAACGISYSFQAFVPHVTLVRARSRNVDLEGLNEIPMSFPCDRFTLYSSSQEEGKRIYRSIASFPSGRRMI